MSQAQIGNLQVALGVNTAQFAKGLAEAQASLGTFGKGLKTFAAAAAGALSLSAIGMAVQSTITRMDDLGKAAQKIGIPVEELSKLEYAAKLADVPLDSLVSTMGKFSRNIAEVAGGGQNDASRALQAIGVSATDAEGKLRPTTAIIMDIADKMSGMRDGAGKTALAISLFGKSGAELIPLLNGGRIAIAEASDELARFGGVVTPEAARAAETFNDNITRLNTAMAGLLQDAVNPLLQPLVDITEAMLRFANSGPQVASGVGTIADALRWLTEGALNAYTAIWSIGELASTALTDPLNTDAWEASLERIRMQAEDTKAAIDRLYNPKVRASASDIQSMLDSIGGDSKTDAPIIPQPTKPQSSPVPKIPQDTIDSIYGAGEAFSTLWDQMAAGIPDTNNLTSAFQSLAQGIADSLGNAIQGLITGTMSVKDAVASMAQSVAQQLSQLAAQLIQSQIFKLLSMLAGGMGGFTVGGMSFGGFYADGGHLGSGKWGIAGEAGPEIVHGPANITPMSGAAAPQMNVTVINNSSAQVNTRQNANGGLEVLVEEMIAEKLIRGGNKIDSALARGYGLRRAGR